MDIGNLISHNTPRMIEKVVGRFVNRHARYFAKAPVKIEDLLYDGIDDLEWELADGLFSRKTYSGLFPDMNGGPTILLLDSQIFDIDLEESNRSLSEEIAHFLIHRELIALVRSGDDFIRLQQSRHWISFEQQAKWGGLCIRVPNRLLIQELEVAYGLVIDVDAVFGFKTP